MVELTNRRKVRGKKVEKEKSDNDKAKVHDKKSEDIESFGEIKSGGVLKPSKSPVLEHFVETNEVEKLKKRVKGWLSTNYPTHIIGPTASGKTTLAMAVAADLNKKIVWVNGSEAMSTEGLIGDYTKIKRETLKDKYIHNVHKSAENLSKEWVDNPLTVACKNGYTLVYNEFSRTEPVVNNILLSVFEEGVLELPIKHEGERYIDVHPEFNAILTSNSTEYAGIFKPQDALLDRIISIHMDYYKFETELEILKAHVDLSNSEAEKVVKIIRYLRENIEEPLGTRAIIQLGKGIKALNGVDITKICLDVLSSKTESKEELNNKKELVKKAVDEYS